VQTADCRVFIHNPRQLFFFALFCPEIDLFNLQGQTAKHHAKILYNSYIDQPILSFHIKCTFPLNAEKF
jgi:hypothetical protein